MRELAPRYYPSGSPVSPTSRFGGQPFVIGATALLAIVIGIGAIAGWRAYTGNAPELDRVVVTRQLQARATQASEQLVEKTKGLEATQQDDTKKLSEQVTTLTESIDGLRQSFASTRSDDPAPSVRKTSRKKVYR